MTYSDPHDRRCGKSVGPFAFALLLGAGSVLAGVFSGLVANRFCAPLLPDFVKIGVLAGVDATEGISFGDS